MIVTRNEYEEALKICLQYKSQIDTDVKSISSENKLLAEMHYQGEISTRLYNIVCRNLSDFLSHLKDVNCRLYTLSDLLKINAHQILRFRNVGKKLLVELQQLQDQYLNK